MQLKIYSGSNFLILTDEKKTLNEVNLDTSILKVDESSNFSIKSFAAQLSTGRLNMGVVFSEDFNLLEKKLSDEYVLIKASGGLVFNEKKESLMIFRRGVWDLPKGKLDEGESIAECALREVEEETGVSNTVLDKFLLNTYHFYEERGQSILKETTWYLMFSPGNQVLIPQAEEQITAIQWTNSNEIDAILPSTYPMIRDVFSSL